MLRVLPCGEATCKLVPSLYTQGAVVLTPQHGQLTKDYLLAARPNYIVCFGYRHIIPKDVIRAMPENSIINCHPSFLPWGRGAHPNFWAWKDGEPHGVTIHAIDGGLDTGPVFVQKKVNFLGDESTMTLESTYLGLELEMISLFNRYWRDIFSGKIQPTKQPEGGSRHRMAELPELPSGWQTTIAEVSRL